MHVLVISGFLGAGKTSFIKAMAKAVKRDFVILENEFSGVNIDGPLLEAASEPESKLTIKELTEGCICCSSRMDFRSTLLTISNAINPDILIVEPSGVAFPSRILNEIKQISYDNIKLLEPVTIIDAESYQFSRREFSAYFDDQLRTAGHIVLSRSENLKPDDFDGILKDLFTDTKRSENTARIIKKHYSKWSISEWKDLLITESGDCLIPEEIEADKSILNISFKPFKAHTPNEIIAILHSFNTGRYGFIIRAKGYFRGENEWFRFDFVNGKYIIGSSPQMPDTRAVVIGKNLNEKLIRKLFEDTFRNTVFSSKSSFNKSKSIKTTSTKKSEK